MSTNDYVEQPDLFSASYDAPGLARRDHPDTSLIAAWRITPKSGTLRRKVLDAIAARPSTDEELQFLLHMSGNTQRPRRRELALGGWIRDSGERRPTMDGNDAIIWTLNRPMP